MMQHLPALKASRQASTHTAAWCKASADIPCLQRRKPELMVIVGATQVLILDEISMVSAEFFAQVEQALRKIRFSDKPCGGIQLILSGDYFQ